MWTLLKSAGSSKEGTTDMRLPGILHRPLARLVARTMASRKPDFIVGEPDDPYMLRWWFIPRNKLFNIYFHEFIRSDDPRALHDHPWLNLSILVEGAYVEQTIAAGGIHHRQRIEAGETRFRRSTFAHRVELLEGVRTRTIFITGPNIRTWGFHCRLGWRPWQEFVLIKRDEQGTPVSAIGPGCGELD